MAGAIAVVVILAGGTLALGESGAFDRAPSADPSQPSEEGSPSGGTSENEPRVYEVNAELCEVLQTESLEPIAPVTDVKADTAGAEAGEISCDMTLGQGLTSQLLQLDVTVTETPDAARDGYAAQEPLSGGTFEATDGPMESVEIAQLTSDSGLTTTTMIFLDGNMYGNISVMVDKAVEPAVVEAALIDFTAAIVKAMS